MSVRVVEYEERWREDFARLNLEWVERWFTVEDADRAVLDDPGGHVLRDGGRILIAVDDDRAVGTVALKHEGHGRYELSKMAVEPDTRGQGVGRLLMDAALDAFTSMGGTELYLESNTRLEPALRLYESVGFVHHPPRETSPYARADVYMVWQPGGRTTV